MSSEFPALGVGIGLRPPHYDEVIASPPAVDWFEIVSENFMVDGGRPLYVLDRVRRERPVVMHGVSLSIGSVDPLASNYLHDLKVLAERIEPAWISDHLCWTGVGGHNGHDLLPLPYTEESLSHVVERVMRVQDFLGRRIALENVSTYLELADSMMPECEFVAEVAERADCALLLDVNNVFVSAYNHGFSAEAYIDAIPIHRVQQFHLAGHTDHGTYLHDTHDHPVRDEVWALYRHAVRRFGAVATLIEWDDRIPGLARLVAEADTARAHARLAGARCDAKPNSDAQRAIIR